MEVAGACVPKKTLKGQLETDKSGRVLWLPAEVVTECYLRVIYHPGQDE